MSRKYRDYQEYSSFPYAGQLVGDRKATQEYLSGIYHTIVVKDVIGRLKNANPMMLESILRFVYASAGSPISTKKIADTMTGGGQKIDVRTVEKYLSAFLDSYIVYVNQETTQYIQVAATARDNENLQRELRPLQRIKDNYPKIILTLDDDPEADFAGIRRINALDWLIQN